MSKTKLLDLNKDWKQARPSYGITNGNVNFNGYQSFNIHGNSITPTNTDLINKSNILRKQIESHIDGDTTFLDLGCANFYFGFVAKLAGAKKVTGVEIDKDYIRIIEDIISNLSMENIGVVDSNVQDYETPHDVVNAMAIIHWLYGCSAVMGSLKNIIDYFTKITNKVLFIEWIDNTDAAIEYFGHLNYNKEFTEDDYNKENFLKYLNDNFSSVYHLGGEIPTRQIYMAVK